MISIGSSSGERRIERRYISVGASSQRLTTSNAGRAFPRQKGEEKEKERNYGERLLITYFEYEQLRGHLFSPRSRHSVRFIFVLSINRLQRIASRPILGRGTKSRIRKTCQFMRKVEEKGGGIRHVRHFFESSLHRTAHFGCHCPYLDFCAVGTSFQFCAQILI